MGDRQRKIDGAQQLSGRPGYHKLVVRLYSKAGGGWVCRWDPQPLTELGGQPLALVASFQAGEPYQEPVPTNSSQ